MSLVRNHDVNIFLEDVGSGMPLVLGHSFLCSGTMWREQVPVLSRKFRVVNLDLRGHGRSGHVEHSFSLYDAVSDVVAVLDQLEIDKAVWCGLSIGGMVALRAAVTQPDRVGGLILLDTDAGAETLVHKMKYGAMGLGVRFIGIGPFVQPIARLMFGQTTIGRNRVLVEQWKSEVRDFHVPSLLRTLEALVKRDSLLERLPEIGVPALVLVGEEDRSLPPAVSQRIHERIPNSTFVRVPGAGHLSALEQPERVTEAMASFISDL